MKRIVIFGVIGILLLLGGAWWSNSISSDDPSIINRKGLHWHPQLEIYVKGEKIDIPEGIGLVGVHNPIHTHDDLPIIHMEFSRQVRQDDIKLSNFFKVWGKEFNSKQIFEHQNGPDSMVHMLVNGQENFEFENYHMRDGDKIEIRYE
jgi:hypothetical protein